MILFPKTTIAGKSNGRRTDNTQHTTTMTKNINRVILNVSKFGGYIYETANRHLTKNPTEPTIVELVFTSGSRFLCNRPFFVEGPLDEAIQCYTSMLKQHDWTYAFSDDPRSYRNGSAEQDEILYAQKILQDRGFDAVALYEEYRPKY